MSTKAKLQQAYLAGAMSMLLDLARRQREPAKPRKPASSRRLPARPAR
jgi:hypothetical protein